MITIINQIKYVLLGKPRTSILLIGVLFLTPSLFLYFVSEDLNFALHLQDSGFLKELKNVWIPTGKFVNQSGLLRPIVETVNLIDYSLWQLNPFGYHLTNTIIHLVNILLVYCFTLQVFNYKQLAISCSLLFCRRILYSFTNSFR